MSVPGIDYVSSWQQRLASRLYAQFRGATTWQQWTVLLGRQFQPLEDAAQSLLSTYDFTSNAGVLLDLVGNLVGQQRLGTSDATYIVYIAGRIIANRSKSVTEDIFGVMRAIFGSTAGPRYLPGYVKQFAIYISGTTLTLAQAIIGVSFLDAVRDSGARAILIFMQSPAAQTFTYDSGPGYDVGAFADAMQAGS